MIRSIFLKQPSLNTRHARYDSCTAGFMSDAE